MKKMWIIGVLLALNLGLGENFLRIPHSLEMYVLDVGQGDSILLRTAEGNTVLIDGGPDAKVLEELGEVLPMLERRLDLVVMTHPDADHVTGLVPVLQRFDVGAVLMSAPAHDTEVYSALLRELERQEIPYYFAEEEVDFQLGTLYLDVLWPFDPVTGQEVKATNNEAVVIRAMEGEHSILLTADIEAEVEEALLASSVNVQAEILKAGHHGSRTSSTVDFLEAVGAEVILISCEWQNDYGHPHEETLEHADDFGMEVFRTDVQGRITVIFGEKGYEVTTEYE